MNMKIAAFAAATALFLAVPYAQAQQASDSQSALAQAPAAEQQRHQRIFGTTPDRSCIDGACSRTAPKIKPPAPTPASGAPKSP
jgi:hypothetical protein